MKLDPAPTMLGKKYWARVLSGKNNCNLLALKPTMKSFPCLDIFDNRKNFFDLSDNVQTFGAKKNPSIKTPQKDPLGKFFQACKEAKKRQTG